MCIELPDPAAPCPWFAPSSRFKVMGSGACGTAVGRARGLSLAWSSRRTELARPEGDVTEPIPLAIQAKIQRYPAARKSTSSA